MELVRQQLADHLGCHMAQVTLFRLEEEEEKDGEKDGEKKEETEDIPFVNGSCYGVVVHSILPLHLSLESEGNDYDEYTRHLLGKFTLSLFTPIPYRFLHKIVFYSVVYCEDEDNTEGPKFYPEDCVRSHPRMKYVVTVVKEGEDTLYGLIEKDPFLQADCFDREEVGREAERLFQKYMADLDVFGDELLTDEELEEPEELEEQEEL